MLDARKSYSYYIYLHIVVRVLSPWKTSHRRSLTCTPDLVHMKHTTGLNTEEIDLEPLCFYMQGGKSCGLYSAQDVADLLCVQREWIYRLIAAGRLKAQRVGRYYVLQSQDIVDYLNSVIPYGHVTLCNDDFHKGKCHV